MHESPVPTFIAYSVGYFTNSDLLRWALEYLPTDEHFHDDAILTKITRLNAKQTEQVERSGSILREFIHRQWPGFSMKAPKPELYANKYFRRRLQEYLDEECTPWEVCRMVNPIEQIYGFPDWLGNMFNACDWVEPNWVASNCRHLEDEVRTTLDLPPVRMPPPEKIIAKEPSVIPNTCECSNTPELFFLSETSKQFLDSLRELGVGNWALLYGCSVCNSKWAIDAYDKFLERVGKKVTDETNWTPATESERKKLLYESRGGEGEDKCIWARCSGKVIIGTAYCLHHLYETGIRK